MAPSGDSPRRRRLCLIIAYVCITFLSINVGYHLRPTSSGGASGAGGGKLSDEAQMYKVKQMQAKVDALTESRA